MAISTSPPASPEGEPPNGDPSADDAPTSADALTTEDVPAPEIDTEPDEGDGRRSIIEWIVVVAGAIVLALLIKTFAVQAFFIPSGSMEPTLLVNDRVLVNKLSYRLHDVNRGDVVVFSHPGGATEIKDLIKRVIGLPGEAIHFDDGRVHINGRPLDEPWLPPGAVTQPAKEDLAFQGQTCVRAAPCTVPPDTVWVMGDNRTNSQDSRYIGPVPQDGIIGRSFVVVWPFNRVSGL
jgi:signal peptidase I